MRDSMVSMHINKKDWRTIVMFKFERKFTEGEFNNLRSILKTIFHLKVNEENVLTWIDDFINRHDGDMAFGDRRWVGVQLLYSTPYDIANRLGFSKIAHIFEHQMGNKKRFWVITDYHREHKCLDLSTMQLISANFPNSDSAILNQLRANEAQVKLINDKRNIFVETNRITSAYVEGYQSMNIGDFDKPFEVLIGSHKMIRGCGVYCNRNCNFLSKFRSSIGWLAMESEGCTLFKEPHLTAAGDKLLRCDKCIKSVAQKLATY